MAVQFIFGGSGHGKSTELIRRIAADASSHPGKNYYVIVPEQATASTQQRLVAASNTHGILNIDVLSFKRLAHRVFEEKGMLSKIILDDIGKNLLLQRAAASCADRLQVLGGGISRPGTISEIKSVLSEFMQYGIDEDCLDDLIDSLPPSQNSLRYKLNDLRILLTEFRKSLGERYLTREELLRVLAQYIPDSGILKGSVVALDGFTGLTPVQREVVRGLAVVCDRVYVTVCIGTGEDPYDYRDVYERFGMSKQMVRQIRELARDAGCPEPESLRLETPAGKRAETFEFLEKVLFDETAALTSDEDPDGRIDLVACHDQREEVLAAVRTVMRLLVEHRDWHYRDIAVIAGDMESLSGEIDQIFTRFEIPHFVDDNRQILDNAFIETVRALFEVERTDYSKTAVFRFLRAGFADLSHEQIDVLENYVTARGICGFDMWEETWDDEEIDGLRAGLIGRLKPFHQIAGHEEEPVLWWTQEICRFLESERVLERLRGFAGSLAEEGRIQLAQEYGQVYSALIHVFDQMTELAADQTVTFGEYEKMLEAGLNEARVRVVPKTYDDMLVGDLIRTRLGDVKALIILGAGASNLPGDMGQKGLLNRWDRDAFDREQIELSPGAKEKIYEQQFYLYQHLTKPTDYLYLSWSSNRPDGKPDEPSYLVEEIRHRFPGINVKSAVSVLEMPEGITALYGMDYLSSHLQKELTGGAAPDPLWRALASILKEDERFSYDVGMMVSAGTYRREAERLCAESAGQLYESSYRRSISQIQQYAACPYKHFLQYGLRIRENEIFEFGANDFGDLYHKALENYGKMVTEAGLRWQDVDGPTRDTWCDEAVELCGLDRSFGILQRSARSAYRIEQIRRMVRRSIDVITRQLEAGSFEPHEYEYNFGTGKIDRLDVYEDPGHIYLKVVDYKTGNQKFDPVREYYGLQLQLPLYMDEAVKKYRGMTDKEVVPAAMFYYKADDPFVEPKPDERVEDAIQKELKVSGVIGDNREILDALDDSGAADSIVAPFGFTQNGALKKYSKVEARGDIEVMMRYAGHYVDTRTRMIEEGKIEVSPYKLEKDRGCKNCPYQTICQFDPKIEGYRELQALGKEAAIEKMREEADP